MFKVEQTIFVSLFLLAGSLLGQKDSLRNIDYFLENVINTAAIEKENSQLYDLIEYYLENPIPLNSANKSELMQLPLVSVDIVDKVIAYRNKSGTIFSYNELMLNAGLTKREIYILKAFTFITHAKREKEKSFWENFSVKFRSRIQHNIQKVEGFKSGYYQGNREKLYNRIQASNNSKIYFGILATKDAGEKSYSDFCSYYLQFNNLIKNFNLLGGYYTVEFGQGLALWSPYSFSKSSEATNTVIKRARGITPYTSAGEYRYMKGIAAKYSSAYFSLSPFYSDSSAGITAGITPIKNFNLSFLYYYMKRRGMKSIPQKEEHFSVAYNGAWENLFLTGEIALFEKAVATINTLQLSILKKFLLVASIRNYDNNYRSFFGTGFGESGHIMNEFGIYFGFKWKTPIGTINFYLDQFKFPYSSNHISLSSKGNELSLSLFSAIVKNTYIYLRYFSEQKEISELFNDENRITMRRLNKLRGEISYTPNRNLKLKTRVELTSFNTLLKSENGILLFQDIQYKLKNIFSLYGRIILFETDGFASRIYEFENDLTGVMTNRPLWGKGLKWYLLLKYMILNRLYLSAKYSELYKPDENSLGSGHNLIKGNVDNKISFQIDYKF